MSENIQVPQGWEVIEFCNIVNLRNKKYIPNQNDNIKCIELECIEKENGNLLYYINSNTQKSTKNYFYKNDVLYGKLRPYLKKYFYATFDGVCSTEIWVFNATNKIDSYYLFLIIQSNKFNQYTNISTGTRMPRADWNIVSNMPILLPPLEEQKKIAEILSLWDKAIEQTKELIAYKEKQKKGLMQKFIYPIKNKTSYRIGDLFNLSRGRVISKQEIEENTGIYPVFSSQTSNNGILGYINTYDYDDELITWTTDGANAGKVFARKGKFNCTNVCGIGKPKSNNICNLIYVSAFLNNITKRYVSYVGNPKLMNNVFEEIEIFLPPIDEQKAIADILSSADKEIELLNMQLELYTEQKKGLMQNLLTGKVRV